jgi:uncharacterized lipoprotein YmbA
MGTLPRTLLLVGVLLLPACFRLARNPPPVLQYTLTGPPPNPAAMTSGITIGVRRNDLAAYLAVPSIVVRRGAHEITTSEFNRWGEKLDEAINRVVSAHLANAAGVRAVDVAPWAARAPHDFVVQLHVARFEGVIPAVGEAARVELQIGWDILRPLDGRVLVRGTTDERDLPWRAGDYASLVQGLDSSLARVALAISRCLSGFRNDSTPPANCGTAATARGR